jgi:Secretion system C-terminal sorting domain
LKKGKYTRILKLKIMKKVYLCFCILMIMQASAQQILNNNWVFGTNNGLQFIPTITPSTNPTNFTGFEGMASVSDRMGNLVLFSDGIHLWYVGPGSVITEVTTSPNFLLGNPSSAQNVIFIPVPTSATETSGISYYVITLNGSTGGTGNGPFFTPNLGLHYSRVRILDGVAQFVGPMNIPLNDNSFTYMPIDPSYVNFSEAITSTLANDNNNYWLLAHVQHVDVSSVVKGFLYSYFVSADHIGGLTHVPQNSNQIILGSGSTPTALSMKISPDRNRIAITHGYGGVELGSFDSQSGAINFAPGSNINNGYTYGVEFSLDSNYLYHTYILSANRFVERRDLNTSTVTTASCNQCWALQRGLDGLIYSAVDNDNKIVNVTNPSSQIDLPLNNNSRRGLPQWVWKQECPEYLFDNENVANGQIQESRQIAIRATNLLSNGARLQYHAGNFIELLPTVNSLTDIGFEAVYGSEFEADIKPCGTPFSYRLSSDNGPGDDLDIKSQPSGRINVYPNPTNKVITISYDDALLETISIYSMDGKLMMKQQLNSNTNDADVSGYANGIYLISVQTTDGKILKSKFVKN